MLNTVIAMFNSIVTR